ncbi:MAG: hypothetical protein HY963_03330 [Ignavibacteriales bacterium]|nr:hypothetical protein [Ignavibacteriales bacterium]
MLERIVNISAGSDYKNSSKPNRFNKSSRYLSTFSSSLPDSISLSPATAFLSTINWRLKRITKSNDKIIINFEFDGYDFTAYVSQNEFHFQNNFEYDIKKIFEKLTERFEVQTLILCQHNIKNSDKLDPKFHLTVLSEMIYRFIDLSHYSYSISVDNSEVKKIFSDMEYALCQEFDYINTCLLSFLEKYLTIKADVINDNKRYDNALIMKQIQLKTF